MIENIRIKKDTCAEISQALYLLDKKVNMPLAIHIRCTLRPAQRVSIALVKNRKNDLCYNSCAAVISAAIQRCGQAWPGAVEYKKPFLQIKDKDKENE